MENWILERLQHKLEVELISEPVLSSSLQPNGIMRQGCGNCTYWNHLVSWPWVWKNAFPIKIINRAWRSNTFKNIIENFCGKIKRTKFKGTFILASIWLTFICWPWIYLYILPYFVQEWIVFMDSSIFHGFLRLQQLMLILVQLGSITKHHKLSGL